MTSDPDRPRQTFTTAPADRRRAFNRELRAAFLASAEEDSIRAEGRGMTETELRNILRRYPGDVPEA